MLTDVQEVHIRDKCYMTILKNVCPVVVIAAVECVFVDIGPENRWTIMSMVILILPSDRCCGISSLKNNQGAKDYIPFKGDIHINDIP